MNKDVEYMLSQFDNETAAFDWLTTERKREGRDFDFVHTAKLRGEPVEEWFAYEREELGKISDARATKMVYERYCMAEYRKVKDV